MCVCWGLKWGLNGCVCVLKCVGLGVEMEAKMGGFGGSSGYQFGG